MRYIVSALSFTLWLLTISLTSQAANTGSEPPPPPPGHRDYYAEGFAAIEGEQWKEAIELLSKVVEARPWHDDGHNLLGFAYRKQGHYDQAFQHYHKALELNPYHRGALEYLGEALLETDQPEQAQATLKKLAEACRRTGGSTAADEVSAASCPEWGQLDQALTQHIQTTAGSMTVASDPVWGTAPVDTDLATSQVSAKQYFRASYRSKTEPIPLNRMHSWVLQLQNADGQPLENTAIAIAGGMPEHDHGLPSAPRVTDYLGNGDYLVEGLKFHMNGWWQITFRIKAAGRTDDITFNLML